MPIVKKGDSWVFDTEAGREEILNRRIGHNELLAINVCRAYVEAQREYYTMPEPDGVQLPKYAQHMISSPGRKNGLYWPTAAGEKESPLGPLVAKAKEEGYMQKRTEGESGPRPFPRLLFPDPQTAGAECAGREVQLCHQRQHGGRPCTGRLPCPVGSVRGHDLHR